MKTRIVHTKIWRDRWFRGLSRDSQILFLYCITNPLINQCGIYELTDEEILFDTKIGDLETAKKELAPKVLFHNDWVFVKKASELSGFAGSKNFQAKTKEIISIPLEVKQAFGVELVDTPSIPYRYPIDTSINNKSKIINHKSETKNIDRVSASDFRDVLRKRGINV